MENKIIIIIYVSEFVGFGFMRGMRYISNRDIEILYMSAQGLNYRYSVRENLLSFHEVVSDLKPMYINSQKSDQFPIEYHPSWHAACSDFLFRYHESVRIILKNLRNFLFRISTSYRNLGHLQGLRLNEIHIKPYRSIARNCLRVSIIKIIPHHICKRWVSARWAWRCQFAHSIHIRILNPYLNPFFEWPINCECVCDDSSLFWEVKWKHLDEKCH